MARAHQAPEDLPAVLLRAKAVLVRRNRHMPLLAPLSDGPYFVLTRSCDFFRLQMGGRTDTVSTSRRKPCMDPAAPPAAPPHRGRPPVQQRDATFHWPPVAPPQARWAVPPVPSATYARTLAAARPSSPPVPVAGTVFPHGQGFFARSDPGQPSTPAIWPQRQQQPPATLDL
jgi:hypothetical protein